MKQKLTLRKKVSKSEIQRITERHKQAVRKWYKKNKDYFREYYFSHKLQIKDNYDRYRKSLKGKEAINRYEQKPSRRKAKTEWMRDFRARNKREKKNGKK